MVLCGCTLRTFRVWHALPNTSKPAPAPQMYYVLRKKTSHVEEFSRENFCEKLCNQEISWEGRFAQDFEREESDSSISYVSGNWFKSPECQSAFNHHQSIDSSHSIKSIRVIRSNRFESIRSSKEIFFKILFTCTCVCARAQISHTFRFEVRTYVRTSHGQKKTSVRHVL